MATELAGVVRRVWVSPDVHLHPEVPRLALLGLMRLWIALPALVLGRRGGGDDRRVHHRPFLEHQPPGRQLCVEGGEDALGQPVGFEQAAELQQRGGVGCGFPQQIDTNETPNRLTVVDGVFRTLVGQPEALLGDVHAQHPLQSNRRASTAFAPGVERLDLGNQRRPRRHRLDLAEKAVPSGQLRLGRVLQLGKAALHRPRPFNRQCPHSRRPSRYRAANKSARS